LAALVPWTTAALGRRSRLSWQFGDWLEAAGLKQHRWRARTGISAFDPPSGDAFAAEAGFGASPAS